MEALTLEAFWPRFVEGYCKANRQKPSTIHEKGRRTTTSSGWSKRPRQWGGKSSGSCTSVVRLACAAARSWVYRGRTSTSRGAR